MSIPDGTLCMVVHTIPEYRQYLGATVTVVYNTEASELWGMNMYSMDPVLVSLNNRPLLADEKCLLPIDPKGDKTFEEEFYKIKEREYEYGPS